MPTAPLIRVIDPDRTADFADLLDSLQAALEARSGGVVQIGRNTAPEPSPIFMHGIGGGVGGGSAERAVREELDRIDPDWSTWLAVDH